MPKQPVIQPTSMVDRMAQALAKAEGAASASNPRRYRRLAFASLKPLALPTKTMVDAAHDAVSIDGAWAINSRREFRRAVRAMILQAINEGRETDE